MFQFFGLVLGTNDESNIPVILRLGTIKEGCLIHTLVGGSEEESEAPNFSFANWSYYSQVSVVNYLGTRSTKYKGFNIFLILIALMDFFFKCTQ